MNLVSIIGSKLPGMDDKSQASSGSPAQVNAGGQANPGRSVGERLAGG